MTDLGLCGAMIHGRTGDRFLDHADFAPILAEASRLEAPIFIHPQVSPKAVRDAYYEGLGSEMSLWLATGAWGWHMETAINALRLIVSGAFERAPNLQIILGHWGEMIPLYLERVDAAAQLSKKLPKSFAQYFREHFYIAPSGIWSWQMLNHAIAELGADRAAAERGLRSCQRRRCWPAAIRTRRLSRGSSGSSLIRRRTSHSAVGLSLVQNRLALPILEE